MDAFVEVGLGALAVLAFFGAVIGLGKLLSFAGLECPPIPGDERSAPGSLDHPARSEMRPARSVDHRGLGKFTDGHYLADWSDLGDRYAAECSCGVRMIGLTNFADVLDWAYRHALIEADIQTFAPKGDA